MDYNELLKLILLPILGAAGTWLAAQLRSKPEKRKDEVSADRAEFELLRDGFAWAKTEILDLRTQLITLKRQQEDTEARCEELETYAHALVRWIKALLHVLNNEPNGASILAKVAVKLPDLDLNKGKE